MAHIGEEIQTKYISSNVIDYTPIYNPTIPYTENTNVRIGEDIYTMLPIVNLNLYDNTKDYKKGDIVTYNNISYKALFDMPLSPFGENTKPKKPVYGYVVYTTYLFYEYWGQWNGDGTVITHTYSDYRTSDYKDVYTFTLSSGITYNVTKVQTVTNILTGNVTTTTSTFAMDIVNAYSPTMSVGTNFIYNGLLYTKYKPRYDAPNTNTIPKLWEITSVSNMYPVFIKKINPLRPFDGANNTPAISAGQMDYTISNGAECNALAICKVLCDSIDYNVTLDVSDPNYDYWLNGSKVLGGGNGVVAVGNSTIDNKRDKDGILSPFPTTKVIYFNTQIRQNTTVNIKINGSNVSVGDIVFCNMISDGLTKVNFEHGIQDFNSYTPDAWGNIAQGVKPKVTKFNIIMDMEISNYDYVVNFHESIIGKNIIIDASDMKNNNADSMTYFNSLTRRARVTAVTVKTIEKHKDIYKLFDINMSVQEIV